MLFGVPTVSYLVEPLASANFHGTIIPKDIGVSMVKEVQQDGKAKKDGKAKGKRRKNDTAKEDDASRRRL